MSEWETSKLHDWVAANDIELGRGNIISKDDINAFPGSYPIYSSSAHNNGKFGEYAKFMFDEELITWSVDGGGNLFHRAKHKFSVTNVCGYMRIKTADLRAPFIYYCLAEQHKYQTFDYTTKAHPSVIRKLYWLPKLDVQVQSKIASILQTVDQAIEKTEALIEKYQQIKAGLMHDLFTRGIGTDGQLRPPCEQAPALYQQTSIGWIPKEWSCVPLDSISKRVTDGSHQSIARETGLNAQVPFIFVSCVEGSKVVWDKSAFISKEVYGDVSRGREPHKNMVLFTVVGSIGRVAVLDDDREVAFERNIACISVNECINASFIGAWLEGSTIQRLSERLSVGNAQKLLSLSKLKTLSVPLPDAGEQMHIVQRIDSVAKHIVANQADLSKLLKEKSGLMHDLLTGKVAVKLDSKTSEMAGG